MILWMNMFHFSQKHIVVERMNSQSAYLHDACNVARERSSVTHSMRTLEQSIQLCDDSAENLANHAERLPQATRPKARIAQSLSIECTFLNT